VQNKYTSVYYSYAKIHKKKEKRNQKRKEKKETHPPISPLPY
jgi:hypothetical protein